MKFPPIPAGCYSHGHFDVVPYHNVGLVNDLSVYPKSQPRRGGIVPAGAARPRGSKEKISLLSKPAAVATTGISMSAIRARRPRWNQCLVLVCLRSDLYGKYASSGSPVNHPIMTRVNRPLHTPYMSPQNQSLVFKIASKNSNCDSIKGLVTIDSSSFPIPSQIV